MCAVTGWGTLAARALRPTGGSNFGALVRLSLIPRGRKAGWFRDGLFRRNGGYPEPGSYATYSSGSRVRATELMQYRASVGVPYPSP